MVSRAGGNAPAFDHRDSGTPEARWSALLDAIPTRPLDLTRYRHLIVVAAHPDDETLGAGGLLALAAESGLTVTVLIATLGEKSHPESPTHSTAHLLRLRRAEVIAAVGLLAPAARVQFLGLPDGELAEHRDRLLAAVENCIEGPATLLVAPYAADGHPDHENAGTVTSAAAKAHGASFLGYPIWLWHWGSAADLPADLVRLRLSRPHQRLKSAALQCHRSQTQPLSDREGDEPVVPPAFAAHFDREYEIFVSNAAPEGAPVAPDAHPSASASLTREFFDDFYGGATDPWGFETRWYEERKRALTVAALPSQRFGNAYEPGCSIGVLTADLAPRCDRLLATDISEIPLRIARERLTGTAGVRFEQRRVPHDWPTETFDLIVLSEIGYYCDATDLQILVSRATASLNDRGVLVACHWRHPVQEYPLSGDEVHAAFRASSELALLAEHREADFLLDVYMRPPAISVAQASGLLG